VLLVFVLSAIGKSLQKRSLERLRAAMKPSGLLCFRDYGRYDHNERRFFDGGNKVADGGYIKGDGTQQCFFELEETRSLFREAGFEEVQPLEYHFNRVHNRKTDVEMRKVFVNGVFRPAAASS
jgi:methyltransferase-like protein 6